MRDAPLQTIADPARRPFAGAIVQDQYDVDTPWHRHDMHQLQYAFEGSIEVEDIHARHLLPRSLAAWIPAQVAHRTSLHRVRSGSILFAPTLVPQPGDRVRVVEVSPLMREMVIGAMRWPLEQPLDETGEAYFAALGRLCGEWIAKQARLSLPTSAEPKLAAAIAFTGANLKTCSVGAVCRAAGLSERSLRRRFHRDLGMSWDEYRRRARVLAAAAMLTEDGPSIGAIAAEVGFESQGAFAKAFRMLTGSTPRAFRAR